MFGICLLLKMGYLLFKAQKFNVSEQFENLCERMSTTASFEPMRVHPFVFKSNALTFWAKKRM